MKKWEISYKEHTIRVENSFCLERLFVDNELQDEHFSFLEFGVRLHGKIRDGDDSGAEVKVALGGLWQVHCRVFVDDRLVFHSKPDEIATLAIERNTIR